VLSRPRKRRAAARQQQIRDDRETVSITGKISTDGTTFVSDKDSKSWTISNPDAVKGHEGHHVTLQAQVDADKNEVHVAGLKMAKNSMQK
jgi:hypothetical protein